MNVLPLYAFQAYALVLSAMFPFLEPQVGLAPTEVAIPAKDLLHLHLVAAFLRRLIIFVKGGRQRNRTSIGFTLVRFRGELPHPWLTFPNLQHL